MTEPKRRAEDTVPLQVIDSSDGLTREELDALKKIAANYKVAQYGMAALLGLGGLIVATFEIWHAVRDIFK